MGKVGWTSEAELWLRDIPDYIAHDNPAAAQRTVGRIDRKAEVLEEFPEIGYLYRPASVEPIRILLCGHYRIAYRIKAGDDIDILGVSVRSLRGFCSTAAGRPASRPWRPSLPSTPPSTSPTR